MGLSYLASGGGPGAWRDLRRLVHDGTADDIRTKLMLMARDVENDAQDLRGVFSTVLVNDCLQSRGVAETLMTASSILMELDYEPPRAGIGDWFGDRLDEIARSGPLVGDFTTSPTLAALMIELAQLEPGNHVYDPACGLGGLLAEAYRRQPGTDLTGREVHPVSWALATLRLYLASAPASIIQADSLLGNIPVEADRILCDPPFGGNTLQMARMEGTGRSARLDTLFVQHCAEAMSIAGRAIIVVPQSFLTRRGMEERLRTDLTRRKLLEGVISLPRSIGAAGVDLALIVLSGPMISQGYVRMVDLSGFLMPGRDRDRVDPLDLKFISTLYALARPDREYVQIVGREDLASTGIYRPAAYFHRGVERRSIEELLAEAEALEHEAAEQLGPIQRLLVELGLRRAD